MAARPNRTGLLRCLALVHLMIVTAAGCTSDGGSSRSSLTEVLVKRYGGDAACVEAVVNRVDDSTADELRGIAEHGLEMNKWQEGPVLEAYGQVLEC